VVISKELFAASRRRLAEHLAGSDLKLNDRQAKEWLEAMADAQGTIPHGVA
jgi:hypothetical protein